MRKAKPKKRIILPDPRFSDVLVTKFVNNIMLQGKKSIAFKIFYDAMDIVAAKIGESENALDVLRLPWRFGVAVLGGLLFRFLRRFVPGVNSPLA